MNEFERMQMAAFREEARELAAETEISLLALERAPMDRDLIDRVFRAMHTLKGSSAMCGLTDVASLTHHAENLLDQARGGKIPVTRNLIDLVLSVNDQARGMVESSNGGSAVDHSITAMLIAWISNFDGSAIGEDSTAPPPQVEPPPTQSAVEGPLRCLQIRLVPDPAIWQTGARIALVLKELRTLGKVVVRADARRVPALDEIDPTLCFLSWEVVLLTRLGDFAVREVFTFVEDSCFVNIEDYDPHEKQDFDCEESVGPLSGVGVRATSRSGQQSGFSAPSATASAAAAPSAKPGPAALPAVRGAAASQPVRGPIQAEAEGPAQQAMRRPAQELLDDLVCAVVAVQARIRKTVEQRAASVPGLVTLVEELEQRTTTLRDRVGAYDYLPSLLDDTNDGDANDLRC